jgi:hypothetical protein
MRRHEGRPRPRGNRPAHAIIVPDMRHPILTMGTVLAAVAAMPSFAPETFATNALGQETSAAPDQVASHEPASAQRLGLDYTVYFGGLHVLDLGVAVGLGARTYDVTSNIRTVGIARWWAPWDSVATTEGRLDGLQVEPQRHRMEGELRGHRRTVAIDFRGSDVADVRLDPPPAHDEDRDPVTPAEMKGTLDPSSALLAMSRRVAADGGCTGRVPVFDGRRRYDVVVVDRGTERLSAGDSDRFSGPALRCDFTFVPIAGYARHSTDPEHLKYRVRTGHAWFAEIVPGEPAVPVRIEMQGDVAVTVVHLRRVQPPPGRATVPGANQLN